MLHNDNDNDKKNGKGKKVKTITYGLRFIDSCRFMQDSLSNLVNNLSGINRKISHAALTGNFYNTYQLSNKDLNKLALSLRKGVYPYEYMDNWNKFNEPIPLVEDQYYSELNKDCAAKEDLKHVQKVCDTFKIKT